MGVDRSHELRVSSPREPVPDVCQFDLAVLEHVVQRPVLHEECMVKGGTICRFKFQPGAQESLIQLRPRPHGDTKLQPSKKQAARKRS